ncbi:eukaryotic mitochondrial regulator protein-domain-containing protein [Phyllosticta citriasiana]|uniref:Eukaryotic mitochondrial regulator protein-domain-containing protein n=1 Tax=Phyllosticta citriasiana TaxID=595635 RepID=A0ABR1KI40_9PEZI
MASRPSPTLSASLSHCVRTQRTSIGTPAQTRAFTQTCRREKQTLLRRRMWDWLQGPMGKSLRDPMTGSTNYLSAYDQFSGTLRRTRSPRPPPGEKIEVKEWAADLKPFPLNPSFPSSPVLSEELREKIYQCIEVEKQPIQDVCATYGVTLQRAAAVVRLKAMEKKWEQDGKFLAKPYSRAVLEMLPKTDLARELREQQPHESTADLPVHAATKTQIFWPAPESSHFTRADAARIFDKQLLPADERIPMPEQIDAARDRLAGLSAREQAERHAARLKAILDAREKEKAIELRKQQSIKRVSGRRFDFRFQDVSVDAAGTDGKSADGVGWRYGMPHEDRKRGQYKLPKRVQA